MTLLFCPCFHLLEPSWQLLVGVCMSERAITHTFGLTLSGVLFAMLILNAFAG